MTGKETVFASSGGEQIDQQPNYPAGGADAAMPLPAPPDNLSAAAGPAVQTYYCRGCGRVLPQGFRGHFHRDCLREDKRRRVRDRRLRETARFQRRLEQARCPACGAKIGTAEPAPLQECSCEASQGP